MIYLLSVSIIVLFVLTVIALWRSGFKHWSLWIIIPFLIFNLGFSWYTISSLMGYPYHNTPPSEHQLLHFIVAKPNIYVLAKELNVEPRLYVFDYDEKTVKQLAEAKRQMQAGQRVMIDKKVRPDGNIELKFYNFSIQRVYPKDP